MRVWTTLHTEHNRQFPSFDCLTSWWAFKSLLYNAILWFLWPTSVRVHMVTVFNLQLTFLAFRVGQQQHQINIQSRLIDQFLSHKSRPTKDSAQKQSMTLSHTSEKRKPNAQVTSTQAEGKPNCLNNRVYGNSAKSYTNTFQYTVYQNFLEIRNLMIGMRRLLYFYVSVIWFRQLQLQCFEKGLLPLSLQDHLLYSIEYII